MNIKRLLTALSCVWVFTCIALADNTWFEQSRNFMAYSLGQGKVHFKVLVFSRGSTHNHWACDEKGGTYIYAEGNGVSRSILYYSGDNNYNCDSDYKGWVRLRVEDGTVVITNTYDQVPVHLQSGLSGTYWLSRTGESDTPTFLEFDWYPSSAFDGKQYTAKAHIVDTRKTGATWERNWTLGTYSASSVQAPMLFDPVFYSVGENGVAGLGHVMIPYVVYQDPLSYYTSFTGAASAVQVSDRSGQMFVMTTDTVQQDFYATFKVKRDGGQTQEVTSNMVKIPAFHRIYDFRAADLERPNGKTDGRYTQLTWSVRTPEATDIMPSDIFQIQRAYEPDFSDAETIGILPIVFDSAHTRYSYIDSTDNALYNRTHREKPVYYRVNRAGTTNWGYEGHQWAAKDSVLKHNSLLTILDDSTYYRKADDFDRTRKIQLVITTQKQSEYVWWDKNAEVVITRKTQTGETGETTRRTVSGSLFKQQPDSTYCAEIELTAEVSCANYTYSVQIDDSNSDLKCGSTSPITVKGPALYYTDAASIASFNASKGYFPDYVFLQWNQTDGNADVFYIERRLSNTQDAWTRIAEMQGEHYYRDITAEAGNLYDYRIICAYSCNGTTLQDTATATGWLSQTGSISGRISYPNGTGNAGVEVRAVAQGETPADAHGYLKPTGSAHTFATAEPMNWSGSRTFQLLIKTDKQDVNTDRRLFTTRNLHSDDITLSIDGQSQVLTLQYGTQVLPFAVTITPDTWTAVSVVCDTEKKTASLYCDGKIIGQQPITAAVIPDSKWYLLHGTEDICIDEVRVWSRALTDREIADNTHSYLSGKEDGLLCYYPFDYTQTLAGTYHVSNMAYTSSSLAQRNDLIISRQEGEIHTTGTPDGATLTYKAVSAESGDYCIGGIPFGKGMTYDVTPTSEHGKFSYNGTSAGFAAVALDPKRPEATGIDFVNTEAVRFTGRVLYRRSTIPVRGAHFLVNGVLATDAAGQPIETNAAGNFEFEVPKAPITIQTVMNGHRFASGGFFHIDGDSLFTPTGNMDGLRMWDETKVRLIGRIAGGNDQGTLPVGFSLSRNNIGDSILMVLELEGDNTAQIVYDPQDKTLDRIDTTVVHAVGKHHTNVTYQQKRIMVYPDTETGEFFVDLFPVKYKLTQLTAQGYSTLTNGNSAMQVLDMTNRLTPDTLRNNGITVLCNDTFRHIYHSPVSISLCQLQYGIELGYLGIEKTYLTDFDSVAHTQDVVYKNAQGEYEYLFGKPIFTEGKYAFRITAHEDYYYNGNRTQGAHDRVMLRGGRVQIYNGMHSDTETIRRELDSNGQAEAVLQADYPTYTRLGDDATRHILISVEHNGEYVQSDPLDVYVFADRLSGVETVNITPVGIRLFDILRDPPGSGSYSSLASGATYQKSENYHLSIKAGMQINMAFGSHYTGVVGAVAAPAGIGSFTGAQIQTSTATPVSIPLSFNGTFNWSSQYQYTTSEQVRTGSDAYHVGSGADVYMGATENLYHGVGHGMTILDSAAYAAMSAQTKNGTMKVIATSRNDQGELRYLVVARKLLYSFGAGATFTYTQEHILTTVIPTLLRERNALILTTDSLTAQRQANATGKRVYYTALTPEDKDFALRNYHWADPQNTSLAFTSDTIAAYNRTVLQWTELIALNEKEKVQAINGTQPYKTYSITGGTPVTHSETVSYSSSSNSQYATPGNLLNSLKSISPTLISKGGEQFVRLIEVIGVGQEENGNKAVDIEANTTGSKFKLSITPIADVDFNHVDGESQSASRTYSYTLSPDAYGYMDVNVYRKKDTINTFNKDASSAPSTDYYYSSFIFYGMAGASRCPYEGGDSTLFYQPGTPLSNPTIAIENPHITVDKREISSVPADQKAVFNLTLSNEQPSDIGMAASSISLELYVVPASNPNGLKLSIDGVALGFTPMKIAIPHGKAVHKVLEVERGQGYDFENIRIRLRSSCNIEERDETAISVHFVPAATALNLSAPHDQWVLNTQSSHDSAGYYLPVVIDGFDVHSDGFDHIELQYKQLNQSDNDWVNLCSYYADDSLYAQASGNKAMIENGKIDNIRFYGERDPMEQHYDLRAVSFARYGNGFITRSSAVLHGIKDTRRPEVFGLPTPADGILSVKDVLSLRFCEPVAGNYLDEDANFEIVGGTNNLDITQTTSLAFSGEKSCVARTSVHRNMNNRAFTIEALIRPAEQGRAMTIFALGDTKQKLRFSLTADNCLRAEVGNVSVTSGKMEPVQDFTRCAMTYDTTGVVRFFAGTKEITLPNQPTLPRYTGNGTLLFGNTADGEEPFHGNMLEARLWTKAQEQDELALTYKKHLTGYERELMAYYPMNEGLGTTCHDLANGAVLRLQGTSWTLPEGMSLWLDGTDGVRLAQDLLSRSATQDLTLMLWFKTDAQTPDTAALFTTGGGLAGEDDAEGKVFIGLQNGNIVLRHRSQEFIARGHYADKQWHQLVYTLNRTYNIGNLFVDGKQTTTFAADRIGSMSGNEMWLGACHWTLTDTLGNRIAQPRYAFSGHIDHLVLYEQSLPNSSIQNFSNMAPSGEEMGLIAYLPFCARQLSDNGRLELRYSPYNARIFRDANGEVVDKKQRLILSDASQMTDKSDFAPVRDALPRTRYNFAWACNGDELMLNLKMLDKEINKQNIFLTVCNVEDLNGNRMLNPMSWTVYVDRNQLRWSENEKTVSTTLNSDTAFDLTITNTGGITRQYNLTSLPSWLTAVPASGSLAPQASQTIRFTVAEGLNVGEHTEYIYLQDDQDLFERLLLTVRVESVCPWTDDNEDLPMSMSLIGQVLLANGTDTIHDTDTNDIIAAFINNRCVGTAHITYDDATLANYVYLTIYGDSAMLPRQGKSGADVQFRLWQASTGKITILDPSKRIRFSNYACHGCPPQDPVRFISSNKKVQQVRLAQGWNWTAFHLNPTYRNDLNLLFTQADWTEGDVIKTPWEIYYVQYHYATDTTAGWYGTLRNIWYKDFYKIYVARDLSLEVTGAPLTTDASRTLTLVRGWNKVPYLLNRNLPLAEALADYHDKAQVGDIIKNRTRFAVFSAAGKWEGNLTYMQQGEGYMLRRQSADTCTLTFFDFNDAQQTTPVRYAVHANGQTDMPVFCHTAPDNMSVLAVIDADLPVDESTTLSAYVGSRLVGRATPYFTDSVPIFFLTIGAEQREAIRFSVEQNAKPVAATASLLSYETDAVVGTIEKPFRISFDQAQPIATPSPFTDYVDFYVPVAADARVTIGIYTATGQMVHSADFIPDRYGCTYRWSHTASLPAGVYTARIGINSDIYTLKLIKQ